jgi:OmpA-OmpF porin, OOP family
MRAHPRSSLVLLFCGAALVPCWPEQADGQIPRRLRDRVEQRVERAVDQQLDRLLPDASQAAAPTPEEQMKPGEGVWANYDFVPGERVLFADDLTRDQIGDFPRRLVLIDGSAEIVDWNNGRYLSVPSFTTFAIPLPETLPEKFTIEFQFYAGRGWSSVYQPAVVFDATDNPRNPQTTAVQFHAREAGVVVGQRSMRTQIGEGLRDRLYHVRIMADGSHMKVFINERRVSNAPNVEIARGDRLLIHIPGWQEGPSLIGNIRVASGGRELYTALQAEGRVVMPGILFDTGSDRLRPESTPTLLEIATVLKENPPLAVTIEGHTDNVGSDASNQTLSERRAAAVRDYLVTAHGIEAARLEARGFGPGRPVASNDTPEGRQQNRRVELVRRGGH